MQPPINRRLATLIALCSVLLFVLIHVPYIDSQQRTQQTIKYIYNDVWNRTNKSLMAVPGAGAQGVSQSETYILNDVWDKDNHMLRVTTAAAGGGSGLPNDPPACAGGKFVNDIDISGNLTCDFVSFAVLTNVPLLNTLPTGLTPNRCVETDSTGKFISAAATCGTGTGGGAPTSARYVTLQADASLTAEFDLSTLGSGVLKQTSSAGLATLALAIAGTDYETPANKDNDGNLAANSATRYASQQATKTYADTKVPLTRTIAGKSLTTDITLASTDLTDSALLARLAGGGTQVITGTFLVPRAVTVAVSGGILTPNCDTTDTLMSFAITAPVTIAAPAPCTAPHPRDMQEMTLALRGSGPHAITWNAVYSNENGIELPATLSGVYYDLFKFIRNNTSAKWGLVATTRGVAIPLLNTLPTGLTASRCVETDATGKLVSASALCGTSGGGAPAGAKYVTIQADPTLTGEVDLSALGSGILKQTSSAGLATLALAVSGTDYETPANKDNDGNLAANSATKYATQQATKTYADTKVPLTRTVAGKALTTDITLAATDLTDSALLARLAGGGTQVISGTFLVPRATTQAVSGGALTPNCDTTDTLMSFAITTAVTINAPSPCTAPNPRDMQELTLALRGSSTHAITWNAAYSAENGIPLPTALTGTYYDFFKFVRNNTSAKWSLVATTNVPTVTGSGGPVSWAIEAGSAPYNVVCDNSTDTTTQLQAAINAAIVGNVGLRLLMPKGGTCVVSSTLTIANVWGLQIDGNGATIKWNGNTTGPMLLLQDARASDIHHLFLNTNATKPAATVIQIENSAGTAVVPTANQFRSVNIECTNGGCTNGIVMAQGAGGNNNNDFNRFHRVSVNNTTNSCVKIDHSQSKSNVFEDFACSQNGTGVHGIETVNGSYTCTRCAGGGTTGAFFFMNQGADNVVIDQGNFEGSARLMDASAGGGSSGAYYTVTIRDTRFAINNLHADGEAVIYKLRGPFRMQGVYFEPADLNKALAVRFAPGGNYGSFIATGNYFSSTLTNPFVGIQPTLREGNTIDRNDGNGHIPLEVSLIPGNATFAQLSTVPWSIAPDGSMTFCTNCTLACGSGGTGALLVRIAGAWTCPSAGGAASTAFSALTSGTNITAAMSVGTGASLGTSGTGTIAATSLATTFVLADSNIPHLNVLSTGLTASRCVETDASGNLVSTAGLCGAGSGNVTISGTPSAGQTAEWTSATAITGIPTPTGTGSYVKATSPTLVTPNIGTPSAAVLTNATGLPISTGVTGLGTGIAAWLATPSSANLLTAVTDETGSGLLVFGTSPTIVTPTIASFTNAAHNHTNAAGGGQLTDAALSAAVGVAKGGTNLTAALDDNLMVGNGTTWQSKVLTDCQDSAGNHLNYNASTNTFLCGTTSSSSATPAFSSITTGTNTAATMTVGTGASLTTSGTGTIAATSLATTFVLADSNVPNLNVLSTGLTASRCVETDGSGNLVSTAGACSTASATPSFSTLSTGTNTTATMTVGTGASIVTSGTGAITATGLTAAGISAIFIDANIPDLNTLSTGLTATRCVETDATGKLSVAAGACGSASGSPCTPAGSTTQVMFNNAGTTAGSSGLTLSTSQILSTNARTTDMTADLTITTADGPIIRCATGGTTRIATLPAASTTSQGRLRLVKTDATAGSCTFRRAGSDTMNNAATDLSVANQNEYLEATLMTSSNWEVTTKKLRVALATDVSGQLPYANMTAPTAASKLLGRGDTTGDWQEISLGSGLTMTGTTLASAGGVTFATAGETTTGTETAKAVTPDGLAGSDYGKKYATLECIPDATVITTGTGKCFFPLHPDFNGWNIVGASAHVGAVATSGAMTVDIQRCGAVATGIRCSGTNVSVFSTAMQIDANEDGTETGVAGTINTSNQALATGQWLRVDVSGSIGTPQGLYVTMVLQKP